MNVHASEEGAATDQGDAVVSGPLLSARDIAELFNVHPSTIRRFAREGRLSAYWVGSTPRFVVSEVASTFRTEASQPPREPFPRHASTPAPRPSFPSGEAQLDRKQLRADLYG